MTGLGPTEAYRPRTASDLGIWKFGDLRLKIYGLSATGKAVTDDMTFRTRRFLTEEVIERVSAMADGNDLGFVIIHPGDAGLSISAHWWIQGSVLCQHIYRREYHADEPMDTIARPVVACVWELEIIDAERLAWQDAMMTDDPDRDAYLRARPASCSAL